MAEQQKTSVTDKASARKGAPRWMKILLFVSLAFNLAIIGVMAGMMSRGGHPRGFGPDLNIGPFAQAFERSDRREINDRLRNRADLRPPRGGDARAAAEQFLNVLRADPFDAGALRSMMEAQGALMVRRAQAGQEAIIKQFETMSHEERLAYADRLEAMMKHHKGGDRARPPRDQ